MRTSKILIFVICILLPILIGGIGGYFTAESIPTWYVTLNKPWFNPPNWIFGPVWTMLYLLMGFASYVVYISYQNIHRKISLIHYGIQLLLNLLWSFLFFYFKNPGLALFEIVILWIMINLTIVSFSKVNKKAAYLLLPYVVWVSFAAILNLYIVLLN